MKADIARTTNGHSFRAPFLASGALSYCLNKLNGRFCPFKYLSAPILGNTRIGFDGKDSLFPLSSLVVANDLFFVTI